MIKFLFRRKTASTTAAAAATTTTTTTSAAREGATTTAREGAEVPEGATAATLPAPRESAIAQGNVATPIPQAVSNQTTTGSSKKKRSKHFHAHANANANASLSGTLNRSTHGATKTTGVVTSSTPTAVTTSNTSSSTSTSTNKKHSKQKQQQKRRESLLQMEVPATHNNNKAAASSSSSSTSSTTTRLKKTHHDCGLTSSTATASTVSSSRTLSTTTTTSSTTTSKSQRRSSSIMSMNMSTSMNTSTHQCQQRPSTKATGVSMQHLNVSLRLPHHLVEESLSQDDESGRIMEEGTSQTRTATATAAATCAAASSNDASPSLPPTSTTLQQRAAAAAAAAAGTSATTPTSATNATSQKSHAEQPLLGQIQQQQQQQQQHQQQPLLLSSPTTTYHDNNRYTIVKNHAFQLVPARHKEFGMVHADYSSVEEATRHQRELPGPFLWRPILCIEAEIPGNTFVGRTILGHPLLVEAMESLFVVVTLACDRLAQGFQPTFSSSPHNNKINIAAVRMSPPQPPQQIVSTSKMGGNYVYTRVRILDPLSGYDLVPCVDRYLSRATLIQSMLDALAMICPDHSIPPYLTNLLQEEQATMKRRGGGFYHHYYDNDNNYNTHHHHNHHYSSSPLSSSLSAYNNSHHQYQPQYSNDYNEYGGSDPHQYKHHHHRHYHHHHHQQHSSLTPHVSHNNSTKSKPSSTALQLLDQEEEELQAPIAFFGMEHTALGEVAFAELSGVVSTQAGWVLPQIVSFSQKRAREIDVSQAPPRQAVISVKYDPQRLSYCTLAKYAVQQHAMGKLGRPSCLTLYYTSNEEHVAAQMHIRAHYRHLMEQADPNNPARYYYSNNNSNNNNNYNNANNSTLSSPTSMSGPSSSNNHQNRINSGPLPSVVHAHETIRLLPLQHPKRRDDFYNNTDSTTPTADVGRSSSTRSNSTSSTTSSSDEESYFTGLNNNSLNKTHPGYKVPDYDGVVEHAAAKAAAEAAAAKENCAPPPKYNFVLKTLSAEALQLQGSKPFLRESHLRFVPLTPYQATRANALVYQGQFHLAMKLLSPRQGMLLMHALRSGGKPKRQLQHQRQQQDSCCCCCDTSGRHNTDNEPDDNICTDTTTIPLNGAASALPTTTPKQKQEQQQRTKQETKETSAPATKPAPTARRKRSKIETNKNKNVQGNDAADKSAGALDEKAEWKETTTPDSTDAATPKRRPRRATTVETTSTTTTNTAIKIRRASTADAHGRRFPKQIPRASMDPEAMRKNANAVAASFNKQKAATKQKRASIQPSTKAGVATGVASTPTTTSPSLVSTNKKKEQSLLPTSNGKASPAKNKGSSAQKQAQPLASGNNAQAKAPASLEVHASTSSSSNNNSSSSSEIVYEDVVDVPILEAWKAFVIGGDKGLDDDDDDSVLGIYSEGGLYCCSDDGLSIYTTSTNGD